MISGRLTTDDCRSIDVRRLQREGLLHPGYYGSWVWRRAGAEVASIRFRAADACLTLIYRIRRRSEEWQSIEQPVMLERTPCRYGGERVWFQCPAVGCGRRVALLYLGDTYFACRHCYRLAYASQRESTCDRAARRADRIRVRLGGEMGLFEGIPPKPKGMRWATYWRLAKQADAYTDKALEALSRRLGIMGKPF